MFALPLAAVAGELFEFRVRLLAAALRLPGTMRFVSGANRQSWCAYALAIDRLLFAIALFSLHSLLVDGQYVGGKIVCERAR